MVWQREVLKQRAKNVLKSTYWNAFVVCLIAIILGGERILNLNRNFTNNDTYNVYDSYNYSDLFQFNDGLSKQNIKNFIDSFIPAYGILLSMAVIVFIIAVVFVFAFKFFISNPINVGRCRFMYYNSKSPASISVMFSTFSKSYLNIVKTMILKDLIILGGLILFVVPGIIFMYMYRMVPFILAENPDIPSKRVLKLSYEMTKGQKMDIFVLDLSFLGWRILGEILCIGRFFVEPYTSATEAELYGALRLHAAKNGICSRGEIGDEYFL